MHIAIDDDVTLFGAVLGTGVPLVVLHGGPGLDHTYLRPWLDPLSRGAQLIYFDQREQGRSRANTPQALTRNLWIDDIERLRLALGLDDMVLFGHSYGGFLGLEYARRYPDRLRGLILCCTAAKVDFVAAMGNAQARASAEQFEALVQGFGTSVATDEALAALWTRILPVYFHRFSERARRAFDSVSYSAAASNFGVLHDIPAFDATEWLGQIRTRTLVLAGDHDWVMPPHTGAAALHRALPQSEVVRFRDSGHFPFIEEPDTFIDVVASWLGSLPRRSGPET
ncbi:MAG TPA: alpha/beta fold hydrolase [Vicinamibacterales bacterium]|nr:alpha/beta fold hydrolase [Vicinamibacterales bacterium]